MIKIGTWQVLPVMKIENFGAYLGDSSGKVLLPKKQLPDNIKAGDTVRVFVYKDSKDRLISTVNVPKITLGEIAALQVKQITKIGAFLDWGLEKDLLLPFKEQIGEVEEGMFYPVALYVDKSERLAATMWIEKYIKAAGVDERLKEKALVKMKTDAENVYVRIKRMGGGLDYDDKAPAEQIEKDFSLSKNAFKKAVGILYKERRLQISNGEISLT